MVTSVVEVTMTQGVGRENRRDGGIFGWQFSPDIRFLGYTPHVFLKSGERLKNVWVTGRLKNECVQVIETAWFIGVRVRERARFWEVGAEGLEVRRRRRG